MTNLPAEIQPALTWPEQASAGVMFRRLIAYIIDIFCIAVFVGLAYLLLFLLGIGSFGLLLPVIGPVFAGLFLLPPLYHILLIGGSRSATFGMRAMDLEVRVWHGGHPGYLQAFVQTAIFYLSLMVWPILFVAIFNRQRRCLHDFLSGVVVVRTGSNPVTV